MNDAPSLAGKVAIVTGAAGLLGREHCLALGRAGASVVAADLDQTACERVAAAVGAECGTRTLGVGVDITDPASVANLHARTQSALGDVDVLVNNAAIDDKFAPSDALEASRFENYALERFRRSLDVNVTGTFICCQSIGARMAERGRGSIVNVASTYGVVAPDQSLYRRPDGTQAFFKSAAYPTTKAAVLGLTRFLAAYFGPRGVRVNGLSPGGVEAGQEAWFQEAYARRVPLGRMAERTDYHGAIVFLASDASAYMTGTNLVVDGGFTVW
jgi:NAD(P)-dependent dehydrogenase (short-subunit alcohol dehydrogenase family)